MIKFYFLFIHNLNPFDSSLQTKIRTQTKKIKCGSFSDKTYLVFTMSNFPWLTIIVVVFYICGFIHYFFSFLLTFSFLFLKNSCENFSIHPLRDQPWFTNVINNIHKYIASSRCVKDQSQEKAHYSTVGLGAHICISSRLSCRLSSSPRSSSPTPTSLLVSYGGK